MTRVTTTSAKNPWFPWNRDHVLLSERTGRWQWYWFAAFLAGAVVIFVIASGVIEFGMQLAARATGTEQLYTAYTRQEQAVLLEGNIYSFLFLGIYGLTLTFVSLLLLFLHRGKPLTGLTYNVSISWKPFWKAGGALLVLLALNLAYYHFIEPDHFFIQNLNKSVIPWFCLGLAVLLLQTLGEELLFRGYLLRILGAIIPYRLIAVSLVMLLFVSQHALNPDVQSDLWFMLIIFTLSEILYFWILFRSRSVMATWGLHWFNNVFAILVISMEPGWKNEMALFKYIDPVLSNGGSYLYNPKIYLLQITGIILFATLILWRRSPFHIPRAE